jgi:hypothetical protein
VALHLTPCEELQRCFSRDCGIRMTDMDDDERRQRTKDN